MVIESLSLNDFRNYETLDISFDKSTNIIYGANAQGKTNILESLYVAGTSKSHKGSKENEMIRFDCDSSHIRVNVRRSENIYTIDINLNKSKKKYISINHVPIKKASDLLGILNIVFFSPEDLNIVKSSPSLRRRFIDMELCQIDKIYLNDLYSYNKALRQRSALLKDLYDHPDLKDTLSVWDEQLIFYGKKVIKRREEFINELSPVIAKMHYEISGKKEELNSTYKPNASYDDYENEFKRSNEKDIKTGQTNIGPHRDDISFKINNIDIRKYGSQGQQRTCALSIKLSEIHFVEKIVGERPVLLLDDVLPELDSERQNLLLSNINSIQSIITCTGLDDFIKNRFTIDKVFNVKESIVTEEKNVR